MHHGHARILSKQGLRQLDRLFKLLRWQLLLTRSRDCITCSAWQLEFSMLARL